MESKQKLLEKVYCLAFRYEAELGSCPQCVLAAIKETFNIGDEATIKSADALLEEPHCPREEHAALWQEDCWP